MQILDFLRETDQVLPTVKFTAEDCRSVHCKIFLVRGRSGTVNLGSGIISLSDVEILFLLV